MKNFQVYCLIAYILIFYPCGENAIQRSQLSLQDEKKCDETSTTDTTDDLEDVEWFKTCVVKRYGLQPLPNDHNFKKPQFKSYLRDPIPETFKQTAMRIERFFKRNNDWTETKNNLKYNTPTDSSKLLVITDARYLYVTFLLFDLSEKRLTVCSREKNKKIKIPKYVCFLPPYGSTSATSDYDVGLIGPSSGSLTIEFNNYFTREFNKPSEQVFDTNIYAFSLEYALPQLFTGLTLFYYRVLPMLDFQHQFQMLELAGAYMKMYRFNLKYFKRLKNYAEENLGGLSNVKNVRNRNLHFKKWIEKLIRIQPNLRKVDSNLRAEHNEVYNAIIEGVGKIFNSRYTKDIAKYGIEMSKALMYAAEAYHTRGAIRHVVGVLQLGLSENTLTVMDLWMSMIENWADANKVFGHCEGQAETCLLAMSKYLFRTFNAMKQIHSTLVNPIRVHNALIKPIKIFLPKYSIFGGKDDPEVLTKQWVKEYKGKETEIPYDVMMQFLKKFKCTERVQHRAKPLSQSCMNEIEYLVEAYDHLLVNTTSQPTTENVILLTKSGKAKTQPVFKKK